MVSLTDDFRGVIYDHNGFIVEATASNVVKLGSLLLMLPANKLVFISGKSIRPSLMFLSYKFQVLPEWTTFQALSS